MILKIHQVFILGYFSPHFDRGFQVFINCRWYKHDKMINVCGTRLYPSTQLHLESLFPSNTLLYTHMIIHKLSPWKVGACRFIPCAGFQVSKKQMFLPRSLVTIQQAYFGKPPWGGLKHHSFTAEFKSFLLKCVGRIHSIICPCLAFNMALKPFWTHCFLCMPSKCYLVIKIVSLWGRILVQVMIYRRPRIGQDDHLDQSEAYDIS